MSLVYLFPVWKFNEPMAVPLSSSPSSDESSKRRVDSYPKFCFLWTLRTVRYGRHDYRAGIPVSPYRRCLSLLPPHFEKLRFWMTNQSSSRDDLPFLWQWAGKKSCFVEVQIDLQTNMLCRVFAVRLCCVMRACGHNSLWPKLHLKA